MTDTSCMTTTTTISDEYTEINFAGITAILTAIRIVEQERDNAEDCKRESESREDLTAGTYYRGKIAAYNEIIRDLTVMVGQD